MIEIGKYVAIRRHGGNEVRVTKVGQYANIRVDKLLLSLNGAVGHPFGLFEVRNGVIIGSLTPAPPGQFATQEGFRSTADSHDHLRKRAHPPAEDTSDEPPAKMPAQKLTDIDVAAMKSRGETSATVVMNLVEGNTGFEERSEYSKAKYIAKKETLHSDKIFILEPNIRLVAKYFYDRCPQRVCFLRPDLLASIMFRASVFPGMRMLLFEETQGLLTASCLQNMKGRGELYFMYRSFSASTYPALQVFDFGPDHAGVFRPIKMRTYIDYLVEQPPPPHQIGDVDLLAEESDSSKRALAELTDAPEAEQISWIRDRLIEKKNLDNIIIVANIVSAFEMLERTFDYLRPSGTIIIFTTSQEDIVSCVNFLKERDTVCLEIVDQACRGMQVLSDRCHAALHTYVIGGYLLTAIKVLA